MHISRSSVEVADDIRAIFNAPDGATAEAYLAKTVYKYEKNASGLSEGWRAIFQKV